MPLQQLVVLGDKSASRKRLYILDSTFLQILQHAEVRATFGSHWKSEFQVQFQPLRKDHYEVLGLQRTATKEHVKEAFKRLALKYHPNKHSQASKAVRDDATLRFKQLSEAYEVLIDDRKRANYITNIHFSYQNPHNGGGSTSAHGHGYGYGYGYRHSHNSQTYHQERSSSCNSYSGGGRGGDLRFMTRRTFLLGVAFAGILLGAKVFIDWSREVLWKIQNAEAIASAVESTEKSKAHRDKA